MKLPTYAAATWTAALLAALGGAAVTAGSLNPQAPPELAVPTGNRAFLKADAAGTQNYLCMPSGWTFIGPQATLFVKFQWLGGTVVQQVATHYLSANPEENGTARATWQSSADSSSVWAKAIVTSTDPNFVDPAAIPWLLLQRAGAQPGPNGGDLLSQTTYIQRINTSGGLMPSTTCTVGERAFVPYQAEYVFYRKTGS